MRRLLCRHGGVLPPVGYFDDLFGDVPNSASCFILMAAPSASNGRMAELKAAAKGVGRQRNSAQRSATS
jgi:hypothetical protein